MLSSQEISELRRQGRFVFLKESPLISESYYSKDPKEFILICKDEAAAKTVHDEMSAAAKGPDESFPRFANFYHGSAGIQEKKVALCLDNHTSPEHVLAILLSKQLVVESDAYNIHNYLLGNPSKGGTQSAAQSQGRGV